MITTAMIAKTVGNTLYGYFAKKGLDKIIPKKDEFATELNKVIFDTLEDYKKKFTIPDQGDKFPFYNSQKIIEELLKFRVMHSDEYSLEDLLNSFRQEPNVISPSKDDIDSFFGIFVAKAQNSAGLMATEMRKTSDQEIFYVSKKIDELHGSIDSLINAFNGDVALQWKDRIEAYVKTMKEFKLETALSLLESLKSSFDETTQKPTNETRAIVEYQIGYCKNFLHQPEEAAKTFIRAYLLSPRKESYKEQAAFMYYRLKEFQDAQKLLGELLSTDPFNPVAWAVTLLMAKDDFAEKLPLVPNLVRKDLRFIRILLTSLNSEGLRDAIKLLREQELIPTSEKYHPFELTIDTYSTYLFWIQIAIHDFFLRPGLDFNEREQNISVSLEILNSLTKGFATKIKGTEISKEYEIFYFLEAYSTYILTGDISAIHRMEEAYSLLINPEPPFVAFCANALQFAEKEKDAIQILEHHGDSDINCLSLLAFCYIKIGNADGYVTATKKLLNALRDVPQYYLQSLLNIIIQVCSFDKQSSFVAANFIEGKEFSLDEEKQLVVTVAELLLEGSDSDKVGILKQFSITFSTPPYLSIIGCAFYFIGEYELSVEIFRRFLDYEEPSRELLYYIYSLYNTKKDTTELLKLLERWRQNFEFHPQFLEAEFNLRAELLDYATCIKIAEYYLSRKTNDESMLVGYAMALDSEGSDESNALLSNYIETLRDFSYSHTINIGRVAAVLIKRKYFEAGIELLYRYAILPENKTLRMDYFMACVQAAQNLDTNVMQDYEVAIVGAFVKYEMDRKVHFIEIAESNKNNSLQKAFLGKAVNEVVSVKRPITNVEDYLKILRIMNKYLYLHDQILEDVKNDPHSGIPMASIEIDPDKPEDIFATMQKLFGQSGTERQDYREAQIERYYNREISFSELVFTALENNYLAAYFHLVLAKKGIMSVPSAFYRHEIPNGRKFAIDFSSLIMIYQICRTHALVLPDKLLISKYIIERLRKDLGKRGSDINSSMSISITSTDFTVYSQQDSTTESDIKYLEGLLKWIEQSCEIVTSTRLVDFSRTMEYRDDQKVFFDYIVNTVLIAEEHSAVLITDDIFYMKSGFIQPINQCSSEMFIKHISVVNQDSCKEFLVNKYIGFSPTSSQLNEEYSRNIAGVANYYNLCLNNLNLANNPSIATPAIDHIKNIALQTNFTIGKQEKDITNVFIHLLRGVEPGVRNYIEALLQLRCMLMAQKLNMIANCLRAAYAVLDREMN